MAQKTKECYCKTGEGFKIGKHDIISCEIKNNILTLAYDAYSVDSSFEEKKEINFCPFCGRSLTKELPKNNMTADFNKAYFDLQHEDRDRLQAMKNTVKAKDGYEYTCSDEPIFKGDYFILNNPHPTSTLKNVLRKCESVATGQFAGHIIPDDGSLVLRYYKPSMCRKVIATNNPEIRIK